MPLPSDMVVHVLWINAGLSCDGDPVSTPWNASPRDSHGTLGPCEDATQGMPIFEENRSDRFKGIDIMRAVRSFDPCLPCGVHMYLGRGRTIEQVHSSFQASRG